MQLKRSVSFFETRISSCSTRTKKAELGYSTGLTVTSTAKMISCKGLVRAYTKYGRKDPTIGDGACGSIKRKFSTTKPIAVKQSRKENELDNVRYQDEMIDLPGYSFVLVFATDNSLWTIDTAAWNKVHCCVSMRLEAIKCATARSKILYRKVQPRSI